MSNDEGIKGKIQKQGEEALGRVAKDVLENSVVTGAIGQVFTAKERASAAQEMALGALNLPTAADIERLTRRVRAVGQRLEGIEDALDRLDGRLARIDAATSTGTSAANKGPVSRKTAPKKS